MGPFMSTIVLDLYPILVASWKTNMWPWLKSPNLHTIRCSIDEMKEGRERILWPNVTLFSYPSRFSWSSTLKCSNTLLMKATQQTTPLLSACTHSPTYALVSFPLSHPFEIENLPLLLWDNLKYLHFLLGFLLF